MTEPLPGTSASHKGASWCPGGCAIDPALCLWSNKTVASGPGSWRRHLAPGSSGCSGFSGDEPVEEISLSLYNSIFKIKIKSLCNNVLTSEWHSPYTSHLYRMVIYVSFLELPKHVHVFLRMVKWHKHIAKHPNWRCSSHVHVFLNMWNKSHVWLHTLNEEESEAFLGKCLCRIIKANLAYFKFLSSGKFFDTDYLRLC